MKKIDVINLVKTHVSGDDDSFRRIAYRIANEFRDDGDSQLYKILHSLLSDAYTFAPQKVEATIGFLKLTNVEKRNLFLPTCIYEDVIGLTNAVNRKIGINCFLFYGNPGTGKTEAAKYLSCILKRDLWSVSISQLIDSRLGETAKNIRSLFDSINTYHEKSKMVVLFDEIDSLALKRTDKRDLREMDRATTELFNGLDSISKDVVIIATTNLYNNFDSALLRRFQKHIDFSRYSKKDLIDIGERFYSDIYSNINDFIYNKKMFKKVLEAQKTLPYPGALKNIIYTSIAFSNPKKPYEYFSRIIKSFDNNSDALSEKKLKKLGFSIREIGLITSSSKSSVARRLNYGRKG